MHFNDSFDAGNKISEIAEDTYRTISGNKMAPEHGALSFVYRISVLNQDTQEDANVFFYMTVTNEGKVWLTYSMKPQWDMETTDLVFQKEESHIMNGNTVWKRAKSHRHYIFSDVFQPMIRNVLEDIMASMGTNAGRPYAWNLMEIARKMDMVAFHVALHGKDIFAETE